MSYNAVHPPCLVLLLLLRLLMLLWLLMLLLLLPMLLDKRLCWCTAHPCHLAFNA